MVALQNAANRAKWVSSTESALFVHTEALHWTSHNEVPLFLSRPIYMASECKRILSNSKHLLTKPETSIDFSVLGFRYAAGAGDVAHTQRSAQQYNNTPYGIPNIGNTCFMNALLQCCRQLLSRIPSHLLPQSHQCPLARALQAEVFSEEDVKQWPCWTVLPLGPQRDASEVLEMWFDIESPLHRSCDHTTCYGVFFNSLLSHKIERHLQCTHCAYADVEEQAQCILRTEPQGNAQNSILTSLQEEAIPTFRCQSCGQLGARRQTTLGTLPAFLIVHINKSGPEATLAAESSVRLSGTDLNRFAVVHHMGQTTTSGHYTATVATQASAFYCDDSTVIEKPNLFTNAWPNAYLVFYENRVADVANQRGDPPPTAAADGDFAATHQISRRKLMTF